MAEAFACACQHGRTEVARWFLDRGQNPDVAPFLGYTGLHLAILHQRVEVVRLLLERGADPSIRGEMFPFDAAGLLVIISAADGRDPVIRQLRELLKPRSAELPPQVPAGGVRPQTGRPARSAPCRHLQSATRSARPS